MHRAAWLVTRLTGVALLSLVMLAGIGSGTGAASSERSVDAPPSSSGRVEVPSLRSDYTKVFRNPDGTLTAEVRTRPVNNKRSDGTWASIDPTLTATVAGEYAWRNRAGPLDVRFALVATRGKTAALETNGGSITFGPEGVASRSIGLVQENRITYANALPGVDFVYESHEDSLKESIVLRDAPRKPVSFRFSVSLQALTPRPEADGSISLLDATGKVALWMPHASMTDSRLHPLSAEPAFSENVEMELAWDGSGHVLTVTPDLAWLQDPARVYPVVIDPTIMAPISGDTFVQTGISSSQAGSGELKAGTFDSGATKARSLLRFNIASVRGKEIISATFSLYEWHSWSCTAREVKARRIDSDWSGSTVNWANQPDYAATAFDVLNVAKGFSGSCPDGWINFDATTVVRQWANDTHPNHGVMVRADNESDNYGWKKFRSEDYGGASTDPKLEVTYNSYPTAVSARTPVNGTVSADTTPTLSGKYNDPDSGDAGHVDFQICSNSNCSSVVLNGSGPNVQPGQPSPWTVATGSALTTGQTYWWRARSDDGRVQSPWSLTASYVANVAPPLTPTKTMPNTGLVTSPTPTFSAVYDDEDQQDTGYVRFELYNATTHALVAAGNGTMVEPGERSKWLLPSSLVDGNSYYWRAWSNDGTLASAPTGDQDIYVAVGGDVFHATVYTGDPAGDGILLAEEWVQINSLTARYEDDEEVQTRAAVVCPASYPAGQECEEVRSVTVGSPGNREFFSSYTSKAGSSDLDQIASALAPATEVSSAPTGSGPIGDALAGWQTPPPLAGAEYALFEEVDPDTGNRSSLWIDGRTRLPLKHVMRSSSNEELGSVYWTYAASRESVSSYPTDFFDVSEPSNPAVSEVVEFHGTEPIGAITDVETGTSFRPFYLGPVTTVVSTSGSEITMCLARVGVVRSVVAADQTEIVVGGELEEELLPDPSGPETAVAADYVEVEDASECDPGAEDAEADLSVISEASPSSTAEASREAYVEPATAIENDSSDPDHVRAGVRGVVVRGYPSTSYIVPVNEDDTSAVLTPPTENTTILITGDLSKLTIDSVAAELELR